MWLVLSQNQYVNTITFIPRLAKLKLFRIIELTNTPQTEDPERDIVLPAIHGTTSILNSALKFPSIKRVVITSSVVAILSDAVASNGSSTPISSSSRVRPLPTPPYNPSSAYRAAKALALDATDRFVAEKKPGFSVINIMPGYIIGRNESVTSTRELVSGSNALVLGIVLGSEPMPGKRPMMVTDLRDVARVEVAALDLEKLKVGEGDSKSFLLDGGSLVTGRKLNDAKEIVRKAFPAAVEEGKLKLGGGVGSAGIVVESKDSTKTFGELQGYEAMVKELVGQYLELLDREERIL